MTNIGKVSGIDAKLDESHRQTNEQKKLERVKAKEKQSFSDIYDIRLLSAELNRTSSEFKLAEVKEANVKLREVIKEMSASDPERIIETFPSEEIISLSKMAKHSKDNIKQ